MANAPQEGCPATGMAEGEKVDREAGTMKIIQLGYVFLPIRGGEEKYIESLSRLFQKNRIETVIVQRGFRDTFGAGKGIRFSEGINVVPVSFLAPKNANGPVLDRAPLYNFLAMRRTLKACEKGDIIVVHYPQLFFPAAWLAKKAKKARVICLSHGITWDGDAKSWKEKMFYRMIVFLNRIALRHADMIVANDRRYLKEAKKWSREHAGKVRVIYNFVDTGFFCPSEKTKREKMILCPRNLRKARGIDLAIRAMKAVNEKEKDARLVILGEGPLKGELQKLIDELGVNAEIRAPVGKEKLREYYRRSAAVTVPSTFSEGTSLAALEAMACETPVVATDVGGLPDVVKDGYNGFLTKVSAGELSEAIIKLLKDRELSGRMGKNGRKLATGKFSRKRWSDEWMGAIREAMPKGMKERG